jgi:hypothetical protein
MEGKKTTENKTPEDEILELIQLIDDNSKSNGEPLFRKGDIFKGWIRIIIGLLAIFIVVACVNIFDPNLLPYGDYLVVLLSVFTVVVAIFSIIVQTAEGSILETRFDRALKLKPSFTDNEKLILKALIKIRSKHQDFKLKDVYDKNKEMFTEKKLMEILYT